MGKRREGERFAPKTRRSVGHARRRAHVSAMRGSRKNRAVDLVVGVGLTGIGRSGGTGKVPEILGLGL